jgi:hypothetical protein
LRSLIVFVLSTVSLCGVATAALLSLLPAVGASVVFTVASHADVPHHHGGYHGNGGYHGYGGYHGGGQSGGGQENGSYGDSSASGGLADFLRDQKGTLTLVRTSSGVNVTASGDQDLISSSGTAPLAVTSQGTLDPGSPPNRFVVAFDNAIVLAAAMPAQAAPNESWSATLQLLMGPDTLQALPVTVKVAAANGNDVKMQGTGQGNFTLSTPMGDQPVSVNATINTDVTAGKLHAYTQKVVQTMTMRNHSVTITTTTSLTSQ